MAHAATHAIRTRVTAAHHATKRGIAVDSRAAAAAGLGAFLVLSVGLTDGGYDGRASTALTLAFAAAAALGAVQGGRVSRGGLAALGVLLALTAWTALSAAWARSGALVEQEGRRTMVYACALAAVLVVVDARRRRALLLGLLGGISLLGLVAIAVRVASGEIVDRFYGTLLEKPVGYPNALGVLAALGIVIALALTAPGAAARPLRGSATFLVLVLGLTGSRGAAVALAAGLCALVAFRPSGSRLDTAVRALVTLVLGGAAWAAVVWTDAGGALLAVAAIAAFLVGSLVPATTGAPGRRVLGAVASSGVVTVLALALLQPVSATSSFRTAYWAVALEEARAHPALGSGAGSFHLAFAERGPNGMFVRDAHSLYLEALSELGPTGLVLVVSLVAVPIAAAIRRRGDPLVAAAGAGFVVFAAHAGLDWDWEMPVVTLAAIGCAGAVLARGPSNEATRPSKGGKT